MYAVSTKYLDAERTSHAVIPSAVHRNPFTGVTTNLDIKDESDSKVTEDATTSNRRMLSLSLPTSQATWDLLTVPGGEITVTKTTKYIDGMTETVPEGVFVVDQDAIGYGPRDSITLTCPDRSLIIARNRFGLNRSSVPGNTVWAEIKRLVEGAWPNAAGSPAAALFPRADLYPRADLFPGLGPSAGYGFPGWSSYDMSATAHVGPWVSPDGDRFKRINDLAASQSLEFFFNSSGLGVLRLVPILTTNSVPVWTVDASDNGVLIEASRTRDLSTVRNAWVITSSASDLHLGMREIKNTDPADQYSTVGPLGNVYGYYDSPVLRTTAAMDAAGRTKLRKSMGVAQQITIEAAPNDALRAGDVILVGLPWIDRTTPRPTELHIIDSVTIPLLPTGTQTILTRSTRPPSADEGSS